VVVPVVVAAAAALVTQVAIGDRNDVLLPVLLAAAAGLVVGLIAAWVAERRSSTILGLGDLAKLTSVPNLAVVARHAIGASRPDDVAMFRDPNSIEAEGYRVLRTALEFVTRTPAGGDGPGPIVLITSPRPGEGKSSVAANLAAATAMSGRRVVLVDGDLRKPQVHRLFRVKNGLGLSSVLRGDATVAEAVQRLDVVDGFALLSAGPPPPDPAEQLANERLELTLHALAQAADLVLVDAPPLLAVTDPTVIVQHCDAVLMVATAGFSSRREWAEAMPRLDVVSANVVGTVLLQPDDRVQATPTYRYAPSAAPSNWWVTERTHVAERTTTDGPGETFDEADGDVDVAEGALDTAAGLAWDDDRTGPEERPESHAWVVDVPTDVTSIDKPSEPIDPAITDGWPTRRTDG
jgi:capsular exopolysaccharide synthesis family protein